MKKEEYLSRLERLLYNIPAEDREEALQFYRDYLEDAGEAAGEVLEALGSPEELAKSIRRDLYGNNAEGDFTRSSTNLPGTYRVPFSTGGKFSGNREDQGSEGRFSGKGNGNSNGNGADEQYRKVDEQTGYYEYEKKREHRERKGKLSTGQWILILVLCLFAVPVLVPVCGGVVAALIGVAVGILGAVFGIGVAGIALVIAAIVVIVAALVKMIATPLTALIMLGGGILSAGLGLLGIVLTVWVVAKVFPAVFKGVVRIFYRIIHRS